MKKNIFIITGLIILSNLGILYAEGNSNENSEGIEFFEGTWEQALKKAREESKPIFLDVYASWCGPCKLLKKNTFSDKDVGQYFNENFINVTLDAEKGDGIKVARELNVRAYPSLFILDASGKPTVYYPGYLKPEELIELGKTGIEQLNKK